MTQFDPTKYAAEVAEMDAERMVNAHSVNVAAGHPDMRATHAELLRRLSGPVDREKLRALFDEAVYALGEGDGENEICPPDWFADLVERNQIPRQKG